MRRLSSLLPVAALGLLAAWPILRADLPTYSADAPNHFYRLVALSWHVQHGDWFPRWFRDINFGFGGPVLHYYSPLTYYIWLAIHLLTPSFSTTFMLGFVVAMVVAVFGMYEWAAEQFESPMAGLTASAAYGLAPYLYFSLFDRVSHPEVWAMAFAPWLFRAAFRLVRAPTLRAGMVLSVSCAIVVLSHNLSALLMTPVLILYCLIMLWVLPSSPDRSRLKTLVGLGLSLGHALALTAFFLIPFALESSYVQLERARMFDYHNSFLTLKDVFAWPMPFDPNHVVNFYPKSLAWPQLAMAAFAVGSVLFYGRRKLDAMARAIILVGFTFAGLVLLNFPMTLPLWEAFPLSNLLQFVWRLLGPGTLLLAWLAGAAVVRLPTLKLQRLFVPIFIASFFFFSLTWTYYGSGQPFPARPTIIDLARFEQDAPQYAGTTNSQEFLPIWVKERPASDSLYQRYLENEMPSRLGPLPSSVTLLAEKTEIKVSELTYDSTEPFLANFNIFYFPGWTATLDGRSIQFHPADPSGTIVVRLPAGRHTLRLALLPTGPQIVGAMVSTLALILLGVFGLVNIRPLMAVTPAWPALAPTWTILFVGLFGVRAFLIDRIENIFWRTELNDIPHPLSVNFDGELELMGFNFPNGNEFLSGDAFTLTLYWRALHPLDVSYSTSVHLVDAYGNRFGQSDNYYPTGRPTTLWGIDKYARDVHTIESLTGVPPGEYRLLVSVYNLGNDGSTFLNIRQGESPVGIEYDLGAVIVNRAWPQFRGPLRLVEGRLTVRDVTVGDYLPLTVLWNSGNSPLSRLTAQLSLTSPDGHSLWAIDLPPARPDYPTDQWTRNELVRSPLTVTLPPDLPVGPARVQIQLLNGDRSPASDVYDLGDINITVPERSFAIPPMEYIVNYDFNETIRLLGYTATADSTILYWQSLKVAPRPLTVFIHRFGNDGAFIAGHDSPPPRITTSWLPGEVLTDVHSIISGDNFEVGLYDPATGERFGEPFLVRP